MSSDFCIKLRRYDKRKCIDNGSTFESQSKNIHIFCSHNAINFTLNDTTWCSVFLFVFLVDIYFESGSITQLIQRNALYLSHWINIFKSKKFTKGYLRAGRKSKFIQFGAHFSYNFFFQFMKNKMLFQIETLFLGCDKCSQFIIWNYHCGSENKQKIIICIHYHYKTEWPG